MKQACVDVDRDKLAPTIQRQLRRQQFGPDLRRFANNFAALQELRHLADYDPFVEFEQQDVVELIAEVEDVLRALSTVTVSELTDFFALLLVGARG